MASMVGNTGGTSAEVNRGPQVTGQRPQPGLIGGAGRAANEALQAKRQAMGARERQAGRQNEQNIRTKENLAGGVRQQAVAKAASFRGGKGQGPTKGRYGEPNPEYGRTKQERLGNFGPGPGRSSVGKLVS